MVEFDYEELVKATENFKTSRLIGKGSHGLVYKGKLKDNKLVAIKKQSNGLQSLCDNSKLDNEIHVLSTLRKNPNVISFLGTSHDSLIDNKLLVMEFMPNASLHDLLHNSAEHSPTWPKRVEIAMQIARAIQFLHEGKPLVIHRDIKSTNVLFDSNWNAKLADFGLAVLPVDSLSQPVVCHPTNIFAHQSAKLLE
ncbi:Serine/threonine-protein kinase-like protein family [Quillaja saponaria]|uniref:Serine/threonine-protein kinase-like protein family n=1 Tax=Quillaja saponaria TaxID=32244 RepID=A0AAD7M143_QUISA|nr:Serine/threonine-protein kinase-like protein family [Quillaja saponaria]